MVPSPKQPPPLTLTPATSLTALDRALTDIDDTLTNEGRPTARHGQAQS